MTSDAIAKSIVKSIDDFYALLSKEGPLLALDIGRKRTGIAFSDRNRKVALAHEIFEEGGQKVFLEKIAGLMAERQVAGLVLGWPLHMDGTEGDNCRVVQRRAFALSRFEATSAPILLWDERRSSIAVSEAVAERVKKKKGFLDHAVAGYILQGVIDALRFAEERSGK